MEQAIAAVFMGVVGTSVLACFAYGEPGKTAWPAPAKLFMAGVGLCVVMWGGMAVALLAGGANWLLRR